MIRSPGDISANNLFVGMSRVEEQQVTGLPHFILREISALVDLRGHDNIIELLDIFEIKGSKKIVLSFRYEKGGDLNQLLYR